MRSAHILHAAVGHSAEVVQTTAPHTAGWLRYFIIGAIVLVVLVAWLCLRGYAKGSDDQK